MKRKYVRRTLWVIASPFILFVVLGVLIYLPPIQNFLVDKAAVYASEATGMHISVGRISLSFPLNLVVTDIKALSAQNDTLLNAERLQLNVQLLPLLKKRVEIDGISLRGVTVDTGDLIDGMQLAGTLGDLFIASHGVAFDPEVAVVNKVLLQDADLSICLNDTAAADTTASDTLYWKIILHEMDFKNVSVALDMPLDTMSLAVSFEETALRNGLVDLHKNAYSLGSFQIKNGNVKYDSGVLPAPVDSLPQGFDPSHLSLTDIGMELDSLHYEGKDMKAIIRTFVWKENTSGLQLVSTEGRLVSDEHTLRVPSLKMETPDSYLELNASVDWDALEPQGGGNLSARLMADIGKPDVMRFLAGMDPEFVHQYPTVPIRIRTGVDGNLDRLKLTTFSAELPGALELLAKGELTNITDSLQRNVDVTLEAETKDLGFVSALAEGVEIPHGTQLEGKLTLAGSLVGTEMLLVHPEFAAADTVPIQYRDMPSVPDDFVVPRALHLRAGYDLSRDAYGADVVIRDFDLHHFLPSDSLYTLSARLSVKGEGLDFFSPATFVNAEAEVVHFNYDVYDLSGMSLSAGLEKSKIKASLGVKNKAMDITAQVNGKLTSDEVAAALDMDIANLDWQALHLIDTRFETSQHIGVRFSSDYQMRHVVRAEMTNTTIVSAKNTIHTEDLFAGFATSRDSTTAFVRAGDMDLSVEGKGYVEQLSEEANLLLAKLSEQWETKTIEQEALRELLPGVCLRLKSGTDNPVANYLSIKGIAYDSLSMDMCASPTDGLNGDFRLYGLQSDSFVLDTISLDVRQDRNGIRMQTCVASAARPQQEAFDILLDGNVGNGDAEILLQYFNAQKEQGVCLGLKADLLSRGIRLKLFPENPILVYRPFTVNKNNYVYLSDGGRIHGDIELYDEQGTGLSFYTNREDSLTTQDMTVELSRINMEEFRRILPYMPDVKGWIGAEVHYISSDESLMVSGDVSVDDFIYEGSALGSWELGGVYLPGDDNDHHVDAYVSHDGEEIVHMGGIYFQPEEGAGGLSAQLDLQQFPLDVANPFVPDHMVELGGNVNGTLAMKGDLSKPLLNGELALDSVTFSIPEMSVMFRLDNEPVQIENSRILFQDFDIYTKGKTPFTINGDVDFSDLDRMTVSLAMHADDYELLNAPRTKIATMYGKMYVDFDAVLSGTLDDLRMRGDMGILGKTDFTYVLRDSPLTVNDRLGDMVTFVDFNDSTAMADEDIQPMALGGMDITMTIHIDQAVQARVDLVEDGSNYMMLEGGGDLSFQYTPQGDMVLTGRYSLISGEMKYEIPVIPLKTFNIQNGSYLEWTGNVMNPQLNIIATERVRASVGSEGQASRMVAFDVGIALSEKLENLGLAFTLEAPEDATVQEQLNAMSAEERGKLAVTMLVTGMYLAEGNSTGGFNMNNALNSFLQSEISNIAGKALDINVDMETVDGADNGGSRTDYNFQFAKRFWNNRIRIVIGGTVSTGNTADQDESFIDNVSVEYRLDNTGTRYVKLFHDKNYESVLEGEITETGVGVVLRKKMSHLGELFIFKTKKNKQD